MVVIRVNGNIHPQQAKVVVEDIHAQAHTGVIVLPPFCELLNELPADEEIQIIHQDARVAELERELATLKAKKAVSEKVCRYCKNRNAPVDQSSCWACDNGNLFDPVTWR